MLKTRIITAVILMAVFIPALFKLSESYWALVMLIVTLLALREWAQMMSFSITQNNVYLLISLTIGLYVIGRMQHNNLHHFFYQSLSIFLVAACFWMFIVPIWFTKQFKLHGLIPKALIGWLLMLPLWLAMVCAKIVDPKLVLVLLATIWIADSAAYFAGKNFGKHKLAPSISPGKTLEGVAGALVAVSLFGVILYFSLGIKNLALFPGLWLVTILGVAGDLFESMMKRQMNLKDSGSLLPGHGGILDRIDGIIPSLPIAILMIYLFNYFKAAN